MHTFYVYVFRFNEFILAHTSNGSYTKSRLISHNTSVIGLVLFICIAVIPEASALKKHCEKLEQEIALKNLQFIKISEKECRHEVAKWRIQVHSPGMWWRQEVSNQWVRKPDLQSPGATCLPNSYSCVPSPVSILPGTLKFLLLHHRMSKISDVWQECLLGAGIGHATFLITRLARVCAFWASLSSISSSWM